MQCISEDMAYLLIIGIFILLAIIIGIIIKYNNFLHNYIYLNAEHYRSTFDSTMNTKSKSFALDKIIKAAYIKIFVNFSQSISILSNLNLNWNDLLTNFFSFQKSSSGSPHELLAFECVFKKGYKTIKNVFSLFFKVIIVMMKLYLSKL